MQHPIQILERYWKFTSFRPLQEDIITSILANEDTFVLLPTGGGKSLCFQIPALAREGICIVISPLIALMKDQVKALNNKGIKALALTSGIKKQDVDTLLDNCIYGNYKFLYLSPERLEQDVVRDRIKQMPVNLIAVDEAHCISQWGNDFRPSYNNILRLRDLHPTVNVVALTASATPKVAEDIIKNLDFISPKIFKQSFKRDNLAYMVFNEEDKLYKTETILKKNKAASIIYVRNRKATIEISNYLNSKQIEATYYHGGLSNIEKDKAFNSWFNNSKQVIVATNAFGMGIDKPDVKTVIHLSLPDSMESYFQEAGRAGRNGEKAYAVLLKDTNDVQVVKNQFLKALPDSEFTKQVYRKLNNYFQIPYGEGRFANFEFNFNHFCNTYNFNTTKTYNTLQLLERTGIINLTKQFNKTNTIQFIISNNRLLSYLNSNNDISTIVKTILRTYGGIMEHETKINMLLIANKAQTKDAVITKALTKLKKDNVITWQESKTDAEITFIEPREDDLTINRISKIIEQQNTLRHQQIEAVINYANNDSVCKQKQLLAYFGENLEENCNVCSVCISNKTKANPVSKKECINAIVLLLEQGEINSRTLLEQLPYNEAQLKNAIQYLLEHQLITITKHNTYKLSHL
ncbi:RecQ family ATP-dependent DNA helicase [Lacinutrix salivirga]